MPTKSAERRQAAITRLVALLKEERLRQGLSINKVAIQAGLSHTMVMRVEKGERIPTIDTLLRVTEALGCDLAEFIDRALRSTTSRQ